MSAITNYKSKPLIIYGLGFSLLELLLVMSIIAILVAITYPMYTHHMVQARRNQAKIGLLQLASKLENYYSLNNQYTGADFTVLGMPDETDDLSYQFQINDITDTTYLIRAVPQGNQASNDPLCGSLQLTETGSKSMSGSGTVQQCW